MWKYARWELIGLQQVPSGTTKFSRTLILGPHVIPEPPAEVMNEQDVILKSEMKHLTFNAINIRIMLTDISDSTYITEAGYKKVCTAPNHIMTQ